MPALPPQLYSVTSLRGSLFSWRERPLAAKSLGRGVSEVMSR